MYTIVVFSNNSETKFAAPSFFNTFTALRVKWWIASGSSSSKDTFEDFEVLSELDEFAITKGPKTLRVNGF